MVGHDLPGLVVVRRLNEDRPGPDEIHLAVRVMDGAEVAVRIYGRPLPDDRDRARFEQEAGGLKALAGDAHVVPIHEVGFTSAGHPFLVMEYCEAGSLHDHMVAVGRFTPSEVRSIGAKLAGALAAAHGRDIVHRNVKPANVLLDAHGEPVLADYGFVSLATADGDFTPPAKPVVPPYAAPEAYLPELMSGAADIFSLGATMYGLLAGWAPRSVDPLAVAVDGDTLVDLPRAPWALMSIIRRAMAHDPRDRYPDADQMRTALTMRA